MELLVGCIKTGFLARNMRSVNPNSGAQDNSLLHSHTSYNSTMKLEYCGSYSKRTTRPLSCTLYKPLPSNYKPFQYFKFVVVISMLTAQEKL